MDIGKLEKARLLEKRVNKNTLYKITCPECAQKWLIPRMKTYICGKCQAIITIDYGAI